MERRFTLEYWIDDGWHVGRLREIVGVFSQGESLEELEDNIRDAYRLMMEQETPPGVPSVSTKEIAVEVG